MSEKTTVLLSDVTIKGDIFEKENLIVDCKVEGDITAEKLQTHSGSNIKGNVNSSNVSLGGIIKGNVKSEVVKIKSSADVDGILNQKTLSVDEGAKLKIKADTY